MSKFKVGDWVVTVHGLSQVEEVVTDRVDGIVMYNTTNGCYQVDFKRWLPQVGEWCWFNMEFLDGWQNPVLMRYGEQDMSRWNIEPFIGTLPSFIKDK